MENQLRLIVYPIIYKVFVHPRWLAGFLPSLVLDVTSSPQQNDGIFFRSPHVKPLQVGAACAPSCGLPGGALAGGAGGDGAPGAAIGLVDWRNWWKKIGETWTTVDGSEIRPAPVEVGSLFPLFTWVLYIPVG